MKPPHALALAALAAAAFAACYRGKDNVPLQSTASGSGGTAATTGAGAASSTSAASTGSGTGTGGTGGGTGTGGAGTGGAPDPCANTLFCDDFESYPVGSPPGGKWGNNMNGGTVAVDGAHVHSG